MEGKQYALEWQMDIEINTKETKKWLKQMRTHQYLNDMTRVALRGSFLILNSCI